MDGARVVCRCGHSMFAHGMSNDTEQPCEVCRCVMFRAVDRPMGRRRYR